MGQGRVNFRGELLLVPARGGVRLPACPPELVASRCLLSTRWTHRRKATAHGISPVSRIDESVVREAALPETLPSFGATVMMTLILVGVLALGLILLILLDG